MVSVIIPIYNSSVFLESCFVSIINQTYTDFEVVCVDDGSVDESRSICEAWVKRDSRFRLYSQKNKGVSAARNLGLDVAKGDFVCFVDADDEIHCQFLETLVHNIGDNDLVICDFTRNKQWKSETSVQKWSHRELINAIIYERIKHPSIVCFLYKRVILDDYRIRFVEGCIKNEDYEFYMKYLSNCIKTIVLTDYVGYYYRPNPSSAMSAPISRKSLTSIEASRRIGIFLSDKGLIDNDSVVLSNGVLTYTYYIAKNNNRDLYDELHVKYDVKKAMRVMINFPVIRKKAVAFVYLLFGKKIFYFLVR